MSKKTIIKGIIVVIILGFFAGYIYSQYKDITSPVELEREVKIVIPSGSTTTRIADILYDAGLIKNSYYFRYYIKSEEIATKLKAGTYNFAAGELSLEDLCAKLQTGVVEKPSVQVTIPEGKKVSETIDILVEAGLGREKNFVDYCENGDFSKYVWIPEKGSAKDPASRLEGFLFPDTYKIDPDWTEAQIIDMLLVQFDKVWTADYQKAADELGYSAYEIVTIASLIEREARLDDERALVASVIYNRLDKDMLLEFCSSIQFLFEEQHDVVLLSDLEIENPYNTYKYAGLPPGPIAAPGKASLEAALHPAESDYLYFRTKEDGTGGHFFTKTYEEHLKAGEKAK